MRSVIAFYRARPLVGVIVFIIGLLIALLTVMLKDGGGIILPIALCVFAGFAVGAVVAYGQRRKNELYDLDEYEAALDPTDPRGGDTPAAH
jgi:hypothetical protein